MFPVIGSTIVRNGKASVCPSPSPDSSIITSTGELSSSEPPELLLHETKSAWAAIITATPIHRRDRETLGQGDVIGFD